MSITRPQTLGGTISASDSDSISDELDAGGLPPGTVVWNADVGAFFKLTASSAALVPDEILAVLNTVGARWIVVTSGGVESVTGAGVDNTDPDNPVITAALMNTALGTANDTITTLVAPAANLDITGLAGNTDGDYEFWYDLIVLKNAGNVITLQPEQLATNQSGEIMGSAGGTAFGADTTVMSMGTNTDASNDIHIAGHGYLTSKSGRNRFFQCLSNYITAVSIQFGTMATWTGTATAITNLRFHSSVSNGLLTGSYVRLRRLRNVT